MCSRPSLRRCPWFKDLKKEDEEAAHSNTGTFMFVPRWLAASAYKLNHGGMTPIDGTPPRCVLGRRSNHGSTDNATGGSSNNMNMHGQAL